MYWHIGPRYRDRPREDNRRDLMRYASSGQPPGLLALDGETAAGCTRRTDSATVQRVPPYVVHGARHQGAPLQRERRPL